MTDRRQLRAVTLIELLVATAVLSLMVLLLIQVLSHTSAAWILGQTQSERRQTSRAVGDAIAQELQSALMPIDPADQKSLQFIINSSAIPADYCHSDTIFWQAPIATDRTYGDVAEVGYFLKWVLARPKNPRPMFCRFFVNPNPTDADKNYLIIKKPAAWLGADVLDRVASADSQDGFAGLFAENVIGFWVRCYDKNANLLNAFDSRQQKVLPKTVRIYLVLIGPASLDRLTEIPNYALAGSGPEPNLEAFIAGLPYGVRETAHAYRTEVPMQNSQ